jgi:hypothetical protein
MIIKIIRKIPLGSTKSTNPKPGMRIDVVRSQPASLTTIGTINVCCLPRTIGANNVMRFFPFIVG